MEEKSPLRASRSSIYDLPTNIISALIYIVPAAFAWIPMVGYFAWILPMLVFMIEKKSNFVRFCAAQSFCIGLIRLVFCVVFDSIRNIALSTFANYGQYTDFIQTWGEVTAPGHAALAIGNIISIALCVVCIVSAILAYKKDLWRIPIVGKVSEFMTTELKPKFKHNTYQ